MGDNIEKLISLVYGNWQNRQSCVGGHPDEEDFTCFLEGKLAKEESDIIKLHIVSCRECAKTLALSLIEPGIDTEITEAQLSRLRVMLGINNPALEIILRLKYHFFELLHSTGDILVGQELLPAPILRARSAQDFKDEIIIFKDFQDIRVEVKVENKGAQYFNLYITAREKTTQKVIKNLRISLISDEHELESHLTDSGCVFFEHILLGKYKLDITSVDHNLATILLDIKI